MVTAAAAACGSDDGKKHAQEVTGGAGGEGGGKPITSGGSLMQPAGGAGGENVGGNGGAVPIVTAGEGGTPMVVEMGGAGGVPPDVLPPVECDPPVFADSKLEDAVRSALGKFDPLTPEDIAGLTTLDITGYEVDQLGGIECFTELTQLDMGYGGGPSYVTDLKPLRYLKKLETLNLSADPVQSLEGLAELPNLTTLSLESTSNTLDFEQLASSPSLERLFLGSNTLGDLTPLGQIATLRELNLRNTLLTAKSSLSALKNLQRLNLDDSDLTDATPLAALTQLTQLEISYLPNLMNFDKLSALVNLTRLYAQSDDLTDLAALQSLTQLNDLNLYNNSGITDITPLVNNAGIGSGDTVYLLGTGLNCQAQAQKDAIAALKARQVSLTTSCP